VYERVLLFGAIDRIISVEPNESVYRVDRIHIYELVVCVCKFVTTNEVKKKIQKKNERRTRAMENDRY